MRFQGLNILMTGGTGHLGRPLLRLLARENARIVLVIRDMEQASAEYWLTDHELIISGRVSFVLWDALDRLISAPVSLNSDKQIIASLPRLDFVIHAATHYGLNSNIDDVFRVNFDFPIKLMKAIMRVSDARFLNIDSFYSLFQTYEHLPAYGLTKRFFQDWAKLNAQADDSLVDRFYNLRLFHCYGRKVQEGRFISSVIKDCILGNDIMLTAGRQQRDFIFIDDAVELISKVVHELANRGVTMPRSIDLGTGMTHSILDVVSLIHRFANSKSSLKFGELPMRTCEPTQLMADGFLQSIVPHTFLPIADGLRIAVAAHYLEICGSSL